MKTAVVLNSAQGRYIRGADEWVQATARAVEHLAERPGTELIASVGLPNWELPAGLAAECPVQFALILPGRDNAAGNRYFNRIAESFGLDRSRTRPVFTGDHSLEAFRPARDRLALEIVDTIYPVSIRPGGRLDPLLERAAAAEKSICNDFRIPWQRKHWRPFYDFSNLCLNSGVEELTRNRLIHWTHSWPGPWPWESHRDFYRDLIAHQEIHVRSARESLARIAAEKKIRASSWKMPQGELIVSFTALPAGRSVELMAWRRSLARYSFEPFGVAVSTSALIRLGCRPVEYFTGQNTRPEGPDLPFGQGEGQNEPWSREQEWRLKGDLDLSGLPTGSVLFLACAPEDVEYIKVKRPVPWPVVNLFT
ncbi:MAG TPA: hypothetical protein VJ417_09360 [Candidatus Glassbacteria bacterium]|nr:hypothetical protein [Candidatus Glassbacteria bacterium]